MWTFFYKSKDRLRDIASQINPNLQAEFTAFIEDEGKVSGEIEGKTSSLLNNLLGFSLKGKTSKRKKTTTEIKNTINEDVVINSLDKYFPKNKYTLLSKDTKVEEITNLKKLIRISGTFKINVKGKNHFERIANFQTMDYVEWKSCFKNISITFITLKDSYTSNRPSPIAQGLANDSKSFEIDGFGTLLSYDNNVINISPLFLGTYFDL